MFFQNLKLSVSEFTCKASEVVNARLIIQLEGAS